MVASGTRRNLGDDDVRDFGIIYCIRVLCHVQHGPFLRQRARGWLGLSGVVLFPHEHLLLDGILLLKPQKDLAHAYLLHLAGVLSILLAVFAHLASGVCHQKTCQSMTQSSRTNHWGGGNRMMLLQGGIVALMQSQDIGNVINTHDSTILEKTKVKIMMKSNRKKIHNLGAHHDQLPTLLNSESHKNKPSTYLNLDV